MVEFELSSEQFSQHSTPDPSLAIRPPIYPRISPLQWPIVPKKPTISFANRKRMRCSTPCDISKPRSTTQERCGIKTHPCRSEIKLCVSTSRSDDLPNCSLRKIHRNHVFPNVLFKQSFPKCCHSGRGGRLARLWARLLRAFKCHR